MRDFPLFQIWCHRDLYRGHGWTFGFYLAPWPREEHAPGDMVRALVMLEGFVSKRDGLRWFWWFADPADRKPRLTDNGDR